MQKVKKIGLLFYRFENSAHSPFLDEPEKFNSIIEEQVIML